MSADAKMLLGVRPAGWTKEIAEATLVTLVMALCALATGCCSSRSEETFDVVSAAWITGDAKDSGTFIFPSLTAYTIAQRNIKCSATQPSSPTTSPEAPDLNIPLPGLFKKDTPFQPAHPFTWAPFACPSQTITINVLREKPNPTDAKVTIDAKSVEHLLSLDWEHFASLQKALHDWLCDQTHYWLFLENPEARYPPDFRTKLAHLWTTVLGHATFEEFQCTCLDPPRRIWYTGHLNPHPDDPKSQPETTVQVTRLEPNQILSIDWGQTTLHAFQQIQMSSVRSTTGGTLNIQIVGGDHVRLFPQHTQTFDSIPAQADPPTSPPDKLGLALPYNPEFHGLFEHLFVPIFNEFDLHNSRLFRESGADQSQESPDREAKFLFLLRPTHYIKADLDTVVSHYESDTRNENGVHPEARDEVSALARQFIIIATKSAGQRDIQQEWNHVLDRAYDSIGNANLPNSDVDSYCHGFFPGKSFLTVRNHCKLNGRAIDNGVDADESIGELLVRYGSSPWIQASDMNLESEVTLYRSLLGRESPLGSGTVRIRFHPGSHPALQKTLIREGDQIYFYAIH